VSNHDTCLHISAGDVKAIAKTKKQAVRLLLHRPGNSAFRRKLVAAQENKCAINGCAITFETSEIDHEREVEFYAAQVADGIMQIGYAYKTLWAPGNFARDVQALQSSTHAEAGRTSRQPHGERMKATPQQMFQKLLKSIQRMNAAQKAAVRAALDEAELRRMPCSKIVH